MSGASPCSDLRCLVECLDAVDFRLPAGTIAEAVHFAAAGLGAIKVSSADITISSFRVAKTSGCSSRIISVGSFRCIQERGNERRAVNDAQSLSFDPCERSRGFIIHEAHARHIEDNYLSFALLMVTSKHVV